MKKNKFVVGIICIAMAGTLLTGCAAINNFVSRLKGELVGNNYTISQFDNWGNKTLTVYGDKITMDCETDESGEPTSYIDITIDGYEWQHVGSTLVFAQEGVDMITDFQMPDEINSNGNSSGLMAVDRFVNNYKNLFGKKAVVVVSSQNGTPIGLFQGDSCYMEVPDDLPKTTRLNIDGKAVYIHRANVDIIPTALFNS